MLKINDYSFGKIIINNELYRKDLIITGDQVHSDWWRNKGHSISLDDISLIIDYQPDILFIGTGKMGMMKVSDAFIANVKAAGVDEVKTARSGKIVKEFNQCKKERKALAIHLTC